MFNSNIIKISGNISENFRSSIQPPNVDGKAKKFIIYPSTKKTHPWSKYCKNTNSTISTPLITYLVSIGFINNDNNFIWENQDLSEEYLTDSLNSGLFVITKTEFLHKDEPPLKRQKLCVEI